MNNWSNIQHQLGLRVFERGWLSSNNVLFVGQTHTALVDSGYCAHATQTVALVQQALQGRLLNLLCSTHLHSDHCGGNAVLQAHFGAALQTFIPPGEAAAVQAWDGTRLSFDATGQRCPRFGFTGLLQPGQTVQLGDHVWQIHAAPGHDPHSVVLFEPKTRTLISADALWENGFGVVFPELVGEPGWQDVARTLDLIEQLDPLHVIPGHGAVFDRVPAALARARSRLAQFVSQPDKHLSYAIKVLLKFHLLEVQSESLQALAHWAERVAYFKQLQQKYEPERSFRDWLNDGIVGLVHSGAARLENGQLKDVPN
jgi:glyoxylase-like metal-dependent hydrolase (beta-lactamase superfamily II)